MRLLSLDIGTRHTGCAFFDDAIAIPLPLETLHHASVEAFTSLVSAIVRERHIDRIIIGLPLLPSGQEGSQVGIVKDYASSLAPLGISIQFLDERYTTPPQQTGDPDALAALAILEHYLETNGS
jgi:putative holliday junction resolvase